MFKAESQLKLTFFRLIWGFSKYPESLEGRINFSGLPWSSEEYERWHYEDKEDNKSILWKGNSHVNFTVQCTLSSCERWSFILAELIWFSLVTKQSSRPIYHSHKKLCLQNNKEDLPPQSWLCNNKSRFLILPHFSHNALIIHKRWCGGSLWEYRDEIFIQKCCVRLLSLIPGDTVGNLQGILS